MSSTNVGMVSSSGADQVLRRGTALFVGLVLGDTQLFGIGHWPVAIGRVRFTDVNQPELSQVLILLIHRFQFANLAKKGWSCVRAKYQHDRSFVVEIRQAEGLVAAHGLDAKRGSLDRRLAGLAAGRVVGRRVVGGWASADKVRAISIAHAIMHRCAGKSE